MKTHEFFVGYKDESRYYKIEFYDAPWYLELAFQFFERLDPCCRHPWWIWAWLSRPHFAIMTRRERLYQKCSLEVTKEWAIRHYDWDVESVEKEQENDHDE